MISHNDISHSAFEQAFASCTLDPSLFTHEAHLRLAWIHITKYGLSQARQNIESQIQQFVMKAGAQDKYHHTLTVAAVYAVSHFINKSTATTFIDFLNENPGLMNNFKSLINSHYTYDIFRSEAAKEAYMAPDVQPFK